MRRRLLGTLLFAFALGCAPAAAQQRDSIPPDSTAYLAPIVVTASAVPAPADRLGFAVTTVSADELAAEHPRYLIDALRERSGAFVDEAAGPGGPTIVRLRGGEEVFTQILLDGVEINQNGGFFDFQGFTLGNLERIEIVRGPQSALYGSSAVSGVVHFITAAGTPGPPRMSVALEGGDATERGGSFRGTLGVSGGGETVRYTAGLGSAYSRGIFAVANDAWTREGSLRLDVTPSPRWNLTANLRFIGVEAQLPVRDPGATRVPLDPNARNDRDRLVTSLQARFTPSVRWSQRVGLSVYREEFRFEDQRDDVAAGQELDFFVFDADFVLNSVLWRTVAEYGGTYAAPLAGAADGLVLAYGTQWAREELSDRTSGEFGDGRQRLDRSSGAVFGEIRSRPLARLDLLAGARLEKYRGVPAQLVPRASAVLEVVPDRLSLRVAAGRAYKVPNLQEQFLDNPFIASNPDLAPETSTSWEAGAELHLARRRLAIGATWFQQRFENLIRSVALEGTTQQINRNLGASRARGVEWWLRFAASPVWSAGLDGAIVETEILDNTGLSDELFPEGGTLPFRPRVVGSAFVALAPTDRLSARIRGTLVGRQTVLSERFSGRREPIDAYGLIGVVVDVAVTDRLGLYTRIDNLLDTAYETAFDRRGMPLTVAAGVSLSN